jgi:hypothetical protein
MHVTAVSFSSSSSSSPSSHFASIVAQITMIIRSKFYILLKSRSNLIIPDQTSTHYHVTPEQCELSADSWRDPILLTAFDVTWSHVTSAYCVCAFKRFQDTWLTKVVSLSALRTGRFYPQGDVPGTHFC